MSCVNKFPPTLLLTLGLCVLYQDVLKDLPLAMDHLDFCTLITQVLQVT